MTTSPKFIPPARGSKALTLWGSTLVRSTVVHATPRIVLFRDFRDESGFLADGPEAQSPDLEGISWCRGWDGPEADALKTAIVLCNPIELTEIKYVRSLKDLL